MSDTIEKLKKQDLKIAQTEENLKTFKGHIDKKFEKVFDKLKPRFTDAQIFSGFFALMTILVGIMIYTEGIKSDARNNETRIENVEEDYKTIINGIMELKTDVAGLKAKQDGN